MPIDIRYHAVSLLAIFLALALGILVGFALVKPEQMQSFVDKIKKDNERTRLENRKELEALRAKDKASQTFEKALLPVMVKGRLVGKRIALIIDHEPDKNTPVSDVRAVLNNAGAETALVITLLPRLAEISDKDIAKVIARRGLTAPPEVDPRAYLASLLGQRIALGGSDFAQYLADENLIKLAYGSDLERPISAAVMLGNSNLEPQMMELIEEPLIKALKTAERRVVGCEEKDSTGASMDFYQRLDLPTVDCIDTYPGQAALVLILAGAEGNFGMKENADRLLPDL